MNRFIYIAHYVGRVLFFAACYSIPWYLVAKYYLDVELTIKWAWTVPMLSGTVFYMGAITSTRSAWLYQRRASELFLTTIAHIRVRAQRGDHDGAMIMMNEILKDCVVTVDGEKV